jgi:nicotinate-nucleotide adenylyltransferase
VSEKRDLWIPVLLAALGVAVSAWNLSTGRVLVGIVVALVALAAGVACLPIRLKRGAGATASFATGVALALVPAMPTGGGGPESVVPWLVLGAAFLAPMHGATPKVRTALLGGAALFGLLGALALLGVVPPRSAGLFLAGAAYFVVQVLASRPRREVPAPPGPRICVFGGTFDPFHRGHRVLAEAALKVNERLLVVVAGAPPHKTPAEAELTEFHHRVAMTRLGCEGLPRTEVLELEGKRPGPSYTVDTLDVLRKSHPSDARFRLLLGADMFQTFPTWHDWEGILERATLLVAARPGFDLEPPPEFEGRNAPVEGLTASEVDVRATDLRRDLREGRDVGDRISPAVRAYIEDHGLYGRSAPSNVMLS